MPRRASFRFLGDQMNLVFHDLDREDEEHCEIQALLRSGYGMTFKPDRALEPLRRGFEACPHCAAVFDSDLPSAHPERLAAPSFRDRGHSATP
ncbi:MAG: hypothetical protein GEU28_03630 [Dehalococcoidia bacterium]|nr:hypothetical protein [Dehalococcoidia bacterium]